MDPVRLKKDEKYNISICSNCFKHEHKSKMIQTESVDEAIYDMIEQRFKDTKEVELYIPEHKRHPGVIVDAEATLDKKFIVPIRIKFDICRNCSKLLGQSYNGILQLRNPTKEILDFVKSELKKATEKNVHCIKEDDVINGRDYRITDAQFTRHIGAKLQNTFGGELILTAKLVSRSRQTSKDLHRVTAMFRYPDFRKGDIVNYRGREVKIISFSKKIFIEDVQSKKKEQINYKDLK